jgi:hypothetical protein
MEPGYAVRLRLSKETHLLPRKRLVTALPRPRGADEEDEEYVGHFEVIRRLKTVIVAVDGLGHDSIEAVLNSAAGAAPAFKRCFEEAANRGSPALSALPTVTWCNWPGVYSGNPPRTHGLIGNAFFDRTTRPFAAASDGADNVPPSFDRADGVRAGFGAFNELASPAAGSIYDALAQAAGLRRALSAHNFYSRRGAAIQVSQHQFPDFSRVRDSVAVFPGHDIDAADALDRTTGDFAAATFAADQGYDVLSVYFPGPDNIAHAVGDDRASPFSPPYTPGPALPQVTVPLTAVSQHVLRKTDSELGKLVQVVESNGYLYATLFVLVADHGLHANHNTPAFNIELYRAGGPGLHRLFETVGRTVWRGKLGPAIESCDVVYAANGGMAQVYVRTQGRTWRDPPARGDIDRVAAMLFIECKGGRAVDPNNPARTATYNYLALYRDLAPKVNPARGGALDGGACGDLPAIFVRVADTPGGNHFQEDFRWLQFVDQITQAPEYASIAAFLAKRRALDPSFDWPELERRIDEMNDKLPAASRTGDILLFMDGAAGYLTVNQGDEFHGWHGGASRSESLVPLLFNVPESTEIGDVVDESFILQALSELKQSVAPRGLRNWDLRSVLVRAYSKLYGSP